MSLLRSLLVHVDASDRAVLRLQVAAALAARHGAQVHAVFADPTGAGDMPYTYAAGAAAAQAVQDAELARRAAARAVFDQLFEENAMARWCELGAGPPAPALARAGSCADLILLGRVDRSKDSGLPHDFVESILIDSGRPALVLPLTGNAETRDRPAVVAWRPTPEATRALHGSLPLLREASDVQVLSWGEEPVPSLGHVDIGGFLRSHGVQAEVRRERAVPRDIGDALLQACRQRNAGLLVMGCYGHSRMRERWLGGATRSVLHEMDVPVLMAH